MHFLHVFLYPIINKNHLKIKEKLHSNEASTLSRFLCHHGSSLGLPWALPEPACALLGFFCMTSSRWATKWPLCCDVMYFENVNHSNRPSRPMGPNIIEYLEIVNIEIWKKKLNKNTEIPQKSVEFPQISTKMSSRLVRALKGQGADRIMTRIMPVCVGLRCVT